mgnify:CR=1 FL=1
MRSTPLAVIARKYNAPTNEENIKMLQDYFIDKIKYHYFNIKESDMLAVD